MEGAGILYPGKASHPTFETMATFIKKVIDREGRVFLSSMKMIKQVNRLRKGSTREIEEGKGEAPSTEGREKHISP